MYTYRYANNVPLRDSDDTLWVNWMELTVTTDDGEILYKNSFTTNHKITDKNIENLVLWGRTRWKVENENNNTLKTKGYNLKHNYGHGKKNLSTLLVACPKSSDHVFGSLRLGLFLKKDIEYRTPNV